MKKSVGLSVAAIVAVLAVGTYTIQNGKSGEKVTGNSSTVMQSSTLKKENQLVKDNTTQVLVDKEVKKEDIVKVVQHGDHWHVFTSDGQEHVTYTNPNATTGERSSFVSVVNREQLKALDVVSVEVHGDHYHVYTRDGKEYLTYTDPREFFDIGVAKRHENKKTDLSMQLPAGLDVVRIVQHGDHYHVYTRDGKEFVVYHNPQALYPNAEFSQYTGQHDHQGTVPAVKEPKLAVKHGDHWHLYADLDKKEEVGVSHEDPRVKYPNIKIEEDKHDHDDDNHGNQGTVPAVKEPKLAVKHGNHWHLYADLDKKEEVGVSHEDPRVKYPNIKIEEEKHDHDDDNHGNQGTVPAVKEPKLAVKHGNHWHLYADLDKKEEVGVSHEDPRVKYPNIKIEEEKHDHDDDNHGNQGTVPAVKEPKLAVKHGDHWHLYADLAKKEEVGVSHEDPRVKYPNIKIEEEKHDHDDDNHGNQGTVPAVKEPKLAVKHGDHWHLYADLAKKEEVGVSHEDPRVKYPNIKIEEEKHDHDDDNHGNQGTVPAVKEPKLAVKHGDHWHLYADLAKKEEVGVSHEDPRVKYPNIKIEEEKHDHDDDDHDNHGNQGTVPAVKEPKLAVKHGDHWHLYADLAKKEEVGVSHEDPRVKYPNIKIEEEKHDHDDDDHDNHGNQGTVPAVKEPKLAVKHGDHWHLYADLAKKEEVGVSHEDPRVKYPNIKIEEEKHDHDDDNHGNQGTVPAVKEPKLAVKHGDHWHLYADLAKKEEVGVSHEDPRVKYPNIKIEEEKHDHDDDNHGNQGTVPAVKEPKLAVKHGNHWHLYADLDKKEEVGVSHEDPRVKYPSIKVEESESGTEHHGQVAGKDFVLSEKLAKQRADLAKQLNLAIDDIRIIVLDGKVIGFEYPHEDHTHFIKTTDDESSHSKLTDDEKRELTAYLRKSYGLLLGTPVTFHKDFVVFAIPHPHQDYDKSRDYYSDVLDPNYDAGHVHPYVVPLATLHIPVITGIPELDFENELIEAARRRGVAPSEVKIKDHKYFVLPGKDHDHYLNILTSREGYDAYFANKLPDIIPNFVDGTYSKEEIVEEVQRILVEAKNKFKEGTVEFRRVARVLEAFEAKLNIPITSTQGYKQALKTFENKYIKGIDDTTQDTPEINEFAKTYTTLIEKLKTYDERTLSQYGIKPQELVIQLRGYVVSKDARGLKEVETYFAAIDRAKKASSDLAPRLAYMDYFVRNLDSDRLSASLRLEVINKLNELYKISGLYRNPQKFREGLKSTALLKEKVKVALVLNKPAVDHENWKKYPRGFYRKEISSAINSMRDFVIRNKEITTEELAEGFGKKLDLFPVHPKKPKK